MAEQFTGLERLAITAAKLDIKAAKKRIREAEDARRAREKEKAAKTMSEYRNRARDNKIRAALLEMTNTAKTYGLKFDAPPAVRANSWSADRYPFTKLHITDVHGRTEVVQIYIKHDGFEW